MSRRCRPSIIGGGGAGGAEGSSCGCGRTGHSHDFEPCLEELIYGELFQDPSMELISSLQEDRTDLGAWDGNTFTGGRGWEWVSGSNEGEGFIDRDALLPWWGSSPGPLAIDLNTTEARTGTTCADFTVFSGTGTALESGNIVSCELLPGYTHVKPAYRIQAGDLVTLSVWAKADTADLGVRVHIFTSTNAFGGPGGAPGSFTDFVPPGDSVYRQYTQTQFIVDQSPSVPTYWLQPRFQAPKQNSATGHVFMDDFSCILTVGDGGTLLCVFAALITIDNSTTETSFLE